VKLALIYPPACDPTGPYPALPRAGWISASQGIEVLPIDAKPGWFSGSASALIRSRRLAGHVERRIVSLRRRRALDHQDQLNC